MNHFTVDFPSSPASEQLPSVKPHQQRRNIFSVPEDVASTTPAAPPPSQVFGSSQFGSGVRRLQFGQEQDGSVSRPQPSHSARGVTSRQPNSQMFTASTSTYATEDAEQDYTEDITEDVVGLDDYPTSGFEAVNRSAGDSLLKFSTNSTRQSTRRSTNKRSVGPLRSALPRKGREDIIPDLARDISNRLPMADAQEPDEVILTTEDLMRRLEEECQDCSDELLLQDAITGNAQELLVQWARSSRHGAPSIGQNTIGPDTRSSMFEKARYLTTLLLCIHHPQMRLLGGIDMDTVNLQQGQDTRSMPQVLLEWLDIYHINYDPLFEQVMTTTPAPSANELYWDAIESFTLRGKFQQVMELLKRGNLNYAVIDTPDGPKAANFTGTQLQTAEDAIYRARQLVNMCPAVQNNDWDTTDQDWDVYRKQLEAEIEHLYEQVESQNDGDPMRPQGNLEIFGYSAKKSGLPFVIYQRLKTVYNIILGDSSEIIGLAQDWLEAAIMLTVWWIPTNRTSVAQWSLDVGRITRQRNEQSDPYLQRLRESFLCVTDPDSDSSFQMNTMDVVEIGLGAVLQGDIQSCLHILKTLSLCAASSVAEVAAWGGWLTSNPSTDGLDQDDMMVLNYGSTSTILVKDDILEKYAEALFNKSVIHNMEGGEIEGWELSFSILSRLDDQTRMHTAISDLLHRLPVTNQERTAKLVEICEQFGLENEGRRVSENFADLLVNTSSEYGTALLCYARAHAENKVRQVIDLLNSYCLVQSKAYPAEDEMDDALKQLTSNPKSALKNIAEVDAQAAEILQFYLAGYACLRRFYDSRDEASITKSTHLRPVTRRRNSAKSLLAAISSAADSIYGGLYDPERRAAIQVDGLLTLLGESTALLGLGDKERVFNPHQMYTLLAAIEDLQTVSDRVYLATEECMEAALRNYHGSLPPSPHAMLKKSVSSGTNSNFSFSMMGSEMLARSEESLGGKSLGSAVMIDKQRHDGVERGWDWRARFKDSSMTGAEVLRYLRMTIAQELSIATLEDDGTGT